jgi:uncharacterized protein
VDYKGIYSVEKFLIARRLMYWQVYFHKTVVSAEFLLIHVLKRAKELMTSGEAVFTTPPLKIFMTTHFLEADFLQNISVEGRNILEWYALLDDNDILTSVKMWQSHPDPVLSRLARSLINRKLFRIKLKDKPFSPKWKKDMLKRITEKITGEEALSSYFLMTGEITNNAYNSQAENIRILLKNGKVKDVGQASDINFTSLTKTVRKYFACYPKELDIN